MFVTLTDLFSPSCFLSHTCDCTSTVENICEFVLGQWLWRELIIAKVRPIHKCIPWLHRERGPSQRRISGYLKELAPGKGEGQTSQEVHRSWLLCLNQSANPVSHFADYAHFPDRTGDTPQGKGDEEARVLYVAAK